MGVKERKEREFKQREREILQAAFKLFQEKNLDSVTIEMIAEEVEIGKGTIYKHFNSKDEIYVSLFVQYLEEIIHRIKTIDSTLSGEEQVRLAIRTLCEFYLKAPATHAVYRQCEQKYNPEHLSDALNQKLTDTTQKKLQLIGKMLQKGIDEGRFIDAPISHLTVIGAAMINGITELLSSCSLRNIIDDPEKMLRLMEDVLIKGIRRS